MLAALMPVFAARADSAVVRNFPHAETIQSIDQRLRSAAGVYRRGERAAAKSAVGAAYFDLFEGRGLEAWIAGRDPALKAELESLFAQCISAAHAGRPTAEFDAAIDRLRSALDALPARFADQPRTGPAVFANSFLIIVREGAEAILILSALIAYLVKTGHAGRVRVIYGGAGAALFAGIVTAVVVDAASTASGQSREITEGFTLLLAAAGFGAGLTLIGQATGENPAVKDRTEASLSSDLRMSFPVGPYGTMLLRHHTGQGAGIAPRLPTMFAGPNADLEFNAAQPNLVEAWYGMTLPWPNIRDPRITFNIGKLDPTGFFDANRFANNEAEQFMATPFVNNPAIEFGGDANGYGFGGRIAYQFMSVYQKGLTIVGSYGYFDAAGDFAESFRKPFHMAEMAVSRKNYGFERNVRTYAWMNRKDHARWATPAGDPKHNRGFGLSWDEDVSTNLGMFLRYGHQDPDVAKFDHSLTLGLRVIGNAWRRSRDHVGFGYGVNRISDDYKRVSTGTDGYPADTNEHTFEAYYKWYVLGSFYLTPDVQYVLNPGGTTTKTACGLSDSGSS
ncbi:MAG: hypothetical protein A3G34_11430 [Candidatus Lindowbacteria bacterium RIFCSPLOWO2_12_FULL_62_27]|nr:MAG: hypothetical protein A3G34_11430 [Candidatus Lindowbacteria bacterium RIFCSPLOWO2_12_FULL_62_27]